MTINFTDEEYRLMRNELKANAINSLIRLMPMERGDAIFYISRVCNVSYGAVREWTKNGAPSKHVNTLLELAKSHDIRIYRYQLLPTRAVVNHWLNWCYDIDKDRHVSKQLFQHWKASMKKGRVA
ncbi:hypothetical protein CAG60_11620 [Vibrio sp. V33_P6A3T137]|uniref:hypothetical protein n=1 Tax=Vibrio sp. V33_P6A3T137 TaxID=1938685 RepID=UPI001372BEBB|nr:hypothetical protein [Vibrio sp. V33_P6A3T137]NAW79504.1 hypothetical protein [Vibrio sp. V33_P6A3T137]